MSEMKVLYFAWLKTKTGTAAETVTPPDSVTDLAGLIDWLRTKSEGHAEALEDLDAIAFAVNQEFAEADAKLGPGDEIAFFPPVTGG